jgi:hypothetical protein
MSLKPKRKGTGLEIKTIKGSSGTLYLFMKTPNGAYHAFAEVEAKKAAIDCGSKKDPKLTNTREMCREVLGF